MEDDSYKASLIELVASIQLGNMSGDAIVTHVVDWLEDESGPFAEGWDMFRQVAPDLDQGDLTDDATKVVRLKVRLADILHERRLAWVLADLDGLVDGISSYLRHWASDADMSGRGVAVMTELDHVRNRCRWALLDSDPRSRGYAASLLTQLRGDATPEALEQRMLDDALLREDDAVAEVAMLIARGSHDSDMRVRRDALSRLGKPAAIWGTRHPAFPMTVARARAQKSAR